MRNRAETGSGKQANRELATTEAMRQMLLPLVAGIAATKQDLISWVHDLGLQALDELLRVDAERIVGPKGKHSRQRTHYHWGKAATELPFGGRRVSVTRPRVRATSGQELKLPLVEHFQRLDPLPERVVNQILLGVSTRGYERSLERPPAGVLSRGTSKSAASRQLVKRTGAKMREYLARRLDDVRLVALMLDGIQVAARTVVVALGITLDGSKLPLGLWQGSTENAALCISLLQDLLARGLKIEGRILCVIDGGKGLRKALSDVLGDAVVVQRCQVHKKRNLLDHLPKSRHAHVGRALSEAYAGTSADTARRRLRTLLSWLERNGEDAAAASLREGMAETLTVLKLGLPPTLQRALSTTNTIENLLGTVRRVTRNVKRWRGGDMVSRWTALGVLAAQQRFRRIRGFRELPLLIRALGRDSQNLDLAEEAA
jgi:putative transposase